MPGLTLKACQYQLVLKGEMATDIMNLLSGINSVQFVYTNYKIYSERSGQATPQSTSFFSYFSFAGLCGLLGLSVAEQVDVAAFQNFCWWFSFVVSLNAKLQVFMIRRWFGSTSPLNISGLFLFSKKKNEGLFSFG